MPPSPRFKRGDVVLVLFPNSDLQSGLFEVGPDIQRPDDDDARGGADLRQPSFQQRIVRLEARGQGGQFDHLPDHRSQLFSHLDRALLPGPPEVPLQHRLDLAHRFLRRQLEHVQILNDSRPFAMIGDQAVIRRAKHRARIKRLPVPIMDKSSGLAQ